MKLINAGLKTATEAQIGLEKGNVYYSRSNRLRIYYDREIILKGESPYRVGNTSLKSLWGAVELWEIEDKNENSTVTSTKATFTPPAGYEFDGIRPPLKDDRFMDMSDGEVKICIIDIITTPALILKPITKLQATRRTWKLKYDDKRAPIIGQWISVELDGGIYKHTDQMRNIDTAYIWEEV